ncbi:hypothetical protein HJG60_010295 [Phyllostomus discolor]|uniref:Uncharacterized protein n=1 Tax=Phyllostomus discolor TaxID=89673 RepID=A0A834EK78_9CHIR|nr:hypothetical protein HJG60_010295 [Phyllostomus discolor]
MAIGKDLDLILRSRLSDLHFKRSLFAAWEMALKERVGAGNCQKGVPEAWLKGKEKSSTGCTKWSVNGTGSALLLAEEAVEHSEGHMDAQGGHSLCCQGVYTLARNKEIQQIISTGVGNSPGKREQSTDLDIRPFTFKTLLFYLVAGLHWSYLSLSLSVPVFLCLHLSLSLSLSLCVHKKIK